jgi:cell division protein FtsI (penicillin-binding protein 3)
MEKPPVGSIPKSIERALILGLILAGWALIVVFRLFQLQVLAHDKYAKRAETQQERLEPIEAPRGTIFDRSGNPLAISSPSQFVVVNPKRIPGKEIAAALLGRILGLDTSKLQEDIEIASQRHHGYLVVDQHVSDEQAATFGAMKLDWLEIRSGSVRTYPNGDVAAHVIGNVDAEGKGAAGVELKLNKDLAGRPGWMRVERDGRDDPYAADVERGALMGKNIGLTIDRELQRVAKEALRNAVVSNHAEHGSLIAMDPNTGEILALENYPTYDLNQHLHLGEKPAGREDLAVVAPFEPGSVFKIVTASAALETTNLRPGSIINCGNGVMTLFGRRIHDHKSYAALSMEDVLAFSSNIGAVRIGMQVGSANLYEYIRRFGFGHRTGIELPAEAPGLVRPLNRWQPTSIGSIPMGHEIAVTSIQLAQAGSVIANGGFLVQPHIVAWKQEPGEAKQIVKMPAPVQVLNHHTVITMRRMMRRVITEKDGTGHRLLHGIAGYTIAGKTGTAQIYDFARHMYTHKYNASFLGFAPMQNPAMVVVVTVTGTTGLAGYGGTAAGPAFLRVMSTALRRMGVVWDAPQEIEELEQAEKEKNAPQDKGKDVDDASLAELNPPTQQEMAEASGSGDAAGQSNAAVIDPNAPKVPNFVGKTVKDVMQEAAESGILVDMFGDGLARGQTPAPGALLIPGEHITVRFAR